MFSWGSLTCRLPASVGTLEGFSAWVTSDDGPRRGKFSFINQEIFIDMSPEELETHNKVKIAVGNTVFNLNDELDLGEFHGDGTQVTNAAAGLSTEPDGTFVKWQTFRSKRVHRVPRRDAQGQYLELRGRPDWVLEVVSRCSFQKDTIVLRQAYHDAKIPEYWLINALDEEIDFQILVYHRRDYEAVRPEDGWYFSPVFGRYFRLERHRHRMGHWRYKLHVK
jgi:Uma2 family endonuclease